MKFRLFEFEDKKWLPNIVRDGMMDYLRFVLNTGNFYGPVAPLIVELLAQTKATQIIDLCSGGGGTIEQVQKNIYNKYNLQIPFVLSDIFPNINAYQFIEQQSGGKITYYPLSLNAADVPAALTGVRTIFSAFHHFDEPTATKVITNAVQAKTAIAIFDGGDKNIFFILAITLLHPIAFVLLTPFFKPFKWHRLLLTYIIPIIPLCTIWDGIISIIRLYSPQKLLKIATTVDATTYRWKSGKVRNKFGMQITYLLGYPVNENE